VRRGRAPAPPPAIVSTADRKPAGNKLGLRAAGLGQAGGSGRAVCSRATRPGRRGVQASGSRTRARAGRIFEDVPCPALIHGGDAGELGEEAHEAVKVASESRVKYSGPQTCVSNVDGVRYISMAVGSKEESSGAPH
jgi:hypothetical protein